jgi:hypothetical protein
MIFVYPTSTLLKQVLGLRAMGCGGFGTHVSGGRKRARRRGFQAAGPVVTAGR